MIFIYALVAIFIAWIWVDYYRLIDVYDKEELKYLVFTFFLGVLSVFIVLGLHETLFTVITFKMNGEFIHDFLYCVFKIGLVEELAKLIPFIIMYKVFRSQIKEPLDYIAYISVSALGFSAAENTMYFNTHGAEIIDGRAVLSTISHMFDSALLIYGFVLYKYHPKKFGIWIIPLFVFFAAFAHGFYDFWLLYEGGSLLGLLITVLYFMFTITLFSIILNNTLNNSEFFTYKKVIDPNLVSKRLIFYYLALFGVQFLIVTFEKNALFAFGGFIWSMFFTGYIIVISSLRLSRFKLVQNRWEPLKISLPFTLFSQDVTFGPRLDSPVQIRVKGDSFNETFINKYYHEYLFLCPVSQRNTVLGRPHIAYIEEKIFLHKFDSYYIARLYVDAEYGPHKRILLRAKTNGDFMVQDKYPIVAVLKINDIEALKNPNAKLSDFEFKEWAFIKPAPSEWNGTRVSDDNLPEPEGSLLNNNFRSD